MTETIEHLAENFWNIRGDFKIAHVINIGTHMSLVRKPDGRFILIDAYEPGGEDRAALMILTGVKDSGYGREHGEVGLKEFVNVKSIMIAD